MGKSRVSVKNKVYNLGLSLKDNAQPSISYAVASLSSLSSKVPTADLSHAIESAGVNEAALEVRAEKPLPSVEEKLRVLDAALVAFEPPGLRATEISRLHNIIVGVKVYQELFAQYVKYRALEAEVVELRRALAGENGKAPK